MSFYNITNDFSLFLFGFMIKIVNKCLIAHYLNIYICIESIFTNIKLLRFFKGSKLQKANLF